MSLQHRWIRMGWVVVCLWIGICHYTQAQERLFIGQGQDGLRILSTENGTVLQTLGAITGVEAIAIDEEQGGLIWVFAGGMLQRLSPQGDPELAILPPVATGGNGNGSKPASLHLQALDGSVRLTTGQSLFAFDAQGELLWQQSLGNPSRRAITALDSLHAQLWVGYQKRLRAFDSTGQIQAERKLKHRVIDLVWDEEGSLWVVGKKSKQRWLFNFSDDLSLLGKYPLPQTPAIKTLAKSGPTSLWAASRKTLYQLDHQGNVLSEQPLFQGQPTTIEAAEALTEQQEDEQENLAPTATQSSSGKRRVYLLLAADGSLWIAKKKRLAHLSEQGERLGEWRLPQRIQGMALATDKNTTPLLRLDHPSPFGFITRESSLSIRGAVDGPATVSLDQKIVLPLDSQYHFDHTVNLGEDGIYSWHLEASETPGGRRDDIEIVITKDSLAPPTPISTRITLTAPNAGNVQWEGVASSVEANSQVVVHNLRTGQEASISAGAAGEFRLSVVAEEGDRLRITVIDAAGNQSDALERVVESEAVPLQVQITQPSAGADLPYSLIRVEGHYSGPPNSGIVVNGVVAWTQNGRFIADHVPLTSGSNTLTATLTDLEERSKYHEMVVNSEGKLPPVVLRASLRSGLPPLTVGFSYEFNQTQTIRQLEIDFDGDGIFELNSTNPQVTLEYTYQTPGLQQAQIRLTDTTGNLYSAKLAVQIWEVTQLDGLLQELWTWMKDQVSTGNIERGVFAYSQRIRPKYQEILTALTDDLPIFFTTVSPLYLVSVMENLAEYVVIIPNEGKRYLYYLYIQRGSDGVWRFRSM